MTKWNNTSLNIDNQEEQHMNTTISKPYKVYNTYNITDTHYLY